MDRIDLLESKVKQMIDLVQSLRQENQALTERLTAAENRYRSLTEERAALDRERDTVRNRIEQLLGDLSEAERAAGDGRGAKPEPQRPAPDPAGHPVLPGLA
jgi:FtsZ-binding cell division protein ZapB